MKIYPHTYDKMYVTDINLSRIKEESIRVGQFASIDDHLQHAYGLVYDLTEDMWVYSLKFAYLERSYQYNFKKDMSGKRYEMAQAGSYNTYCAILGGFDPRHIKYSLIYRLVLAYIDELYPEFMEYSPFEYEYVYPYEDMTISYLYVVQNMDERIDLLDYAEEMRMKYGEFVDFVINQAMNINEELGWIKYGVNEKTKYGHKIEKYEQKTNKA